VQNEHIYITATSVLLLSVFQVQFWSWVSLFLSWSSSQPVKNCNFPSKIKTVSNIWSNHGQTSQTNTLRKGRKYSIWSPSHHAACAGFHYVMHVSYTINLLRAAMPHRHDDRVGPFPVGVQGHNLLQWVVGLQQQWYGQFAWNIQTKHTMSSQLALVPKHVGAYRLNMKTLGSRKEWRACQHSTLQWAVKLTPLPGNKIFEIFSHMCNICNTDPEQAVTALGRVISGYTAT